MGLPRGWAADPASFSASFPPPTGRLAPGTYKVTATIAPQYVRLLHITAADATASVKLTVVKGRGCCAAAPPDRSGARSGACPAASGPVPGEPARGRAAGPGAAAIMANQRVPRPPVRAGSPGLQRHRLGRR